MQSFIREYNNVLLLLEDSWISCVHLTSVEVENWVQKTSLGIEYETRLKYKREY